MIVFELGQPMGALCLDLSVVFACGVSCIPVVMETLFPLGLIITERPASNFHVIAWWVKGRSSAAIMTT